MTAFPAIVPSSRTFTPGEYPTAAFSGYSGKQDQSRKSNVFLTAQLQLAFIAINETDMLAIWAHYSGKQGFFNTFTLPAEITSGSGISDYVPSTYLWRYAQGGSVEDLPCGGHNVALTLETLPPIEAAAAGVQLQITVTFAPGKPAGGAPGANFTVEFLLSAGTAIAESAAAPGFAPGIQSTIGLLLTPGGVGGGISGFSGTLTQSLTAGGAGGGAAGATLTITTSLAAGAGSSESVAVSGFAPGIASTLVMSVATTGGLGDSVAVAGTDLNATLNLSAGAAFADSAYWRDWTTQNYGWERFFFIDWWGS